jgi:rubrerythrin
VHASTKKHKCIFCNLFLHENRILQHYRIKHKSLFANAFKCKFYCRKYFLTEADREEHIASAHKICLMRSEAKCLYCNKIYIGKHVLKYHITQYHSAVKIRCKFIKCGQFFHTETEADEHFKQQHQKMEENKKYRCLKCPYRSADPNSLKIHIYRIHEEKILPCPKCSRCFSSSLTFKYHVKRGHSPPKVCPHCKKIFLYFSRHLK